MMILWPIGFLVACAAAGIAFFITKKSQTQKTELWLALLETDAQVACRTGAVGFVEGLASDDGGQLGPIASPFTGRPCLAFHVEIIREEHRGRVTTWERVFED